MKSLLLTALLIVAHTSSMAATLPEVEALVTKVTKALPHRFDERPMLFGDDVCKSASQNDPLASENSMTYRADRRPDPRLSTGMEP